MTPKELLLKVKEHILEEPLRLNMHEGLVTFAENGQFEKAYAPSGVPPCGTVACIAGWCCVLSKRINLNEETGVVAWGQVKPLAADLLGFGAWDSPVNRLFYNQMWPDNFKEKLATKRPGTPEYAAIVAARIDAWIEEQGL